MSITTFLNNKGFYCFEGNSEQVPGQMEDLISLTNKPNIKIMMEIGFNAGNSAELFLKNNTELILTSFDLGCHDYVSVAKEYIDANYPNRHTLILGDSRKTIPEYIENNKDAKFDFIFIDGGHEYEVAKADIENCFHFAHQDTVVALDDTVYTPGWEGGHSVGPTRAWVEKLEEKKIIEINRNNYRVERGMSWGKYVL